MAPRGLCDAALPFLAWAFSCLFLHICHYIHVLTLLVNTLCTDTGAVGARSGSCCLFWEQCVPSWPMAGPGELCGLLAQPQAPRLLWGFLARKRRSLPSGREHQAVAPGRPRASSFVFSVPNWSGEGPTPVTACLHFFFQICAQTYFRPVDHNHGCPQTSHSSDFLISHVSPCLHPLSEWPGLPKASPCTPAPPAWHNQQQAQMKRRKQLQAVSGAKAEH